MVTADAMATAGSQPNLTGDANFFYSAQKFGIVGIDVDEAAKFKPISIPTSPEMAAWMAQQMVHQQQMAQQQNMPFVPGMQQQQFPIPSQFRSPNMKNAQPVNEKDILRGATYFRRENGYKGQKYYDSPSASATDANTFHDGKQFVTRSTNKNIKNANALLKDAEDVLVNEMNNLIPAPHAGNMTADQQHMNLNGSSAVMQQAKQAAEQLNMLRDATASSEQNQNVAGYGASVLARGQQLGASPALNFGQIDLMPHALAQTTNLRDQNEQLRLALARSEAERAQMAMQVQQVLAGQAQIMAQLRSGAPTAQASPERQSAHAVASTELAAVAAGLGAATGSDPAVWFKPNVPSATSGAPSVAAPSVGSKPSAAQGEHNNGPPSTTGMSSMGFYTSDDDDIRNFKKQLGPVLGQ